MYIESSAGIEELFCDYKITDEINGFPVLETGFVELNKNHTGKVLLKTKDTTDVFVLQTWDEQTIGEGSQTELIGIHEAVEDMISDYLYMSYTGEFTVNEILGRIFRDTGYTFQVDGYAGTENQPLEDFGEDEKMALINDVCETWGMEYRISGRHYTFDRRRGSTTEEVFRYKMNITGSKVNLDTTNLRTYIRGYFGEDEDGNAIEREYTHPLADVYGIKHAKPISNARITDPDNQESMLKRKLDDTLNYSFEFNVVDLKEDNVQVGDTVWAIDERMNVQLQNRVVKKVIHYNFDDKVVRVTNTLGSKSFIDAINDTELTVQDVEDIIKNMDDRGDIAGSGGGGDTPELPEDWLDEDDVRDIVRDMDDNDEIEGNAGDGSDYELPEYIEVRGVNGLPNENAADIKELIISPNERDRTTANNPFIHMDGFDQVTPFNEPYVRMHSGLMGRMDIGSGKSIDIRTGVNATGGNSGTKDDITLSSSQDVKIHTKRNLDINTDGQLEANTGGPIVLNREGQADNGGYSSSRISIASSADESGVQSGKSIIRVNSGGNSNLPGNHGGDVRIRATENSDQGLDGTTTEEAGNIHIMGERSVGISAGPPDSDPTQSNSLSIGGSGDPELTDGSAVHIGAYGYKSGTLGSDNTFDSPSNFSDLLFALASSGASGSIESGATIHLSRIIRAVLQVEGAYNLDPNEVTDSEIGVSGSVPTPDPEPEPEPEPDDGVTTVKQGVTYVGYEPGELKPGYYQVINNTGTDGEIALYRDSIDVENPPSLPRQRARVKAGETGEIRIEGRERLNSYLVIVTGVSELELRPTDSGYD